MRKTIAIVASFIALAGHALAVPLNDINVGDAYYFNEFGSNSKVYVVRVDRSSNRVKIRREGGLTEWTTADRLLTSAQSTGAEVTEAVGWGVLFAAGICALSEDCRESVSKSDSQTSGK